MLTTHHEQWAHAAVVQHFVAQGIAHSLIEIEFDRKIIGF